MKSWAVTVKVSFEGVFLVAAEDRETALSMFEEFFQPGTETGVGPRVLRLDATEAEAIPPENLDDGEAVFGPLVPVDTPRRHLRVVRDSDLAGGG